MKFSSHKEVLAVAWGRRQGLRLGCVLGRGFDKPCLAHYGPAVGPGTSGSPLLRPGYLAVWYVEHADFSDDDVERRRYWLSAAERLKAASFKFTRDSRAYLITHLALRAILGRYLGRRPEQLEIAYDPHGRPELREGHQPISPWFSLSHCDSAAAILVSGEPRIGVDIESLNRSVPLDAVQAFFSAAEVETIQKTDVSLRPRVFLELWTLKEAFSKAKGLGLALPLDQSTFSVSGPDNRVDAVFDAALGEHPPEWRFQTLTIRGHQCALAAHCGPTPKTEPFFSVHHLSTLDGRLMTT
jgi:4'-phosphopantetheinyl transferase